MKFLGLFLVFLLIVSISFNAAYALSREDKAKQLNEREQALKYIPKPVNVTRGYNYNIIVLDLSNSCLKMIKAKIDHDCLTYKDLAQFDNTNKKYSGKFFDDDGFYHRGKPAIKNHEIVYRDSNDVIVCVDCPGNIVSKAKSIIVEPFGFTYKLNSDKTMKNNTRYEYHDRYVKDCFHARVSSDLALIRDTISYLQSGCTLTGFDEKITIVKPYSKLTYDGAYYKYMKWLEEAKKLKTTNCLKSEIC